MSDKALPAKKTRSGSSKRQRADFVNVRVTTGERAMLTLGCERTGLSAAAYFRQETFGTAGPRAKPRPVVERVLLASLLAQLGKCGSNLNQIARALNSGGDADMPRIDEAIAEFRALCRALAAALGRPFSNDASDTDQAA